MAAMLACRDARLVLLLFRYEVALVDARNDLPRLHLIALLDEKLDDAARYLGVHIDFLGVRPPPLDLIIRRGLAAAAEARNCQTKRQHR